MKQIIIILLIGILGYFPANGQYFQTNYSGNPYNPMSFLVLDGTIDGISLQAGDEIGVFDGNLCVGAGIFTGNFPFAFAAASDDPLTTTVDGFTNGNTIVYKLYRQSDYSEINNIQLSYVLGNGTFQSQGTEAFILTGISVLPLSASIQVIQEIDCFGNNSGSLIAVPQNGLAPYSYQWSNGSSSAQINNLSTGNYTVTVSDAINAEIVESYFLSEPSNLTINAVVNHVVCPGGTNGSISIFSTGATLPLSLNWNNQETTAQISNLPAGVYAVTIQDANQCEWTESWLISEPDSLINGLPILYLGEDTMICEGNSIELTANNFVSYLWSNGETNQTIEISESGNYNLTAIDANGCEFGDQMQLTVHSLPLVDLGDDAEVCQGESISLNIPGFTTYLWSNGETNSSIELSQSGSYSLTVTDANGCENSDQMQLTVHSLPLVDLGDEIQYSCPNEPVVLDGGVFASYIWLNGETTQSISVSSGTYSLIAISIEGCEGTSAEVEIIASPWCLEATAYAHELHILDSTSVLYDDNPLEPGSFIGVFYNDNGTEICGGWIYWNGNEGSFLAYGDDPLQAGVQGFATGEEFLWKYYLPSNYTEVTVNVEYSTQYSHTSFFASGGESGILSLSNPIIQEIDISAGWSYFSTYMLPPDPSFFTVFAAFESYTDIIKDQSGGIFWPSFGINFIGDMVIGEAYQIFALQAFTLEVPGTIAVPETIPLNIPVGWSFLGYIRTSSSPIEDIFINITSSILIVKDSEGMVYFPSFGVNYIGDMLPGEGYQVLATSAATLIYPANNQSISKHQIILSKPEYFPLIENTGNNMSVGIVLKGVHLSEFTIREIAAFDSEGNCIGSAVAEGDYVFFPVWGKDKHYESETGIGQGGEFTIQFINEKYEKLESKLEWIKGEPKYKENDIAIARIQILNLDNQAEEEILVFPNPFEDKLSVEINSLEDTRMMVQLFDLTGKVIGRVYDGDVYKGINSIQIDIPGLQSGMYIIQVQLGNSIFTERITCK